MYNLHVFRGWQLNQVLNLVSRLNCKCGLSVYDLWSGEKSEEKIPKPNPSAFQYLEIGYWRMMLRGSIQENGRKAGVLNCGTQRQRRFQVGYNQLCLVLLRVLINLSQTGLLGWSFGAWLVWVNWECRPEENGLNSEEWVEEWMGKWRNKGSTCRQLERSFTVKGAEKGGCFQRWYGCRACLYTLRGVWRKRSMQDTGEKRLA